MQFDGDIEVRVMRGGTEITRVTRPLRQTVHGPAVKFRRRLWPVIDSSIDITGRTLDDEARAQEETSMNSLIAVNDDDRQQEAVITASPQQRIVVDAGPGTGKTFVACQRVSHLIREGINPGRIWIVSFTRTAVHEIRNRLADSLDDPAQAAGVRIATLDSHAWAIQSGFSKDAALTGSHDDNIAATLSQIKNDEDVQDYLERVNHLIVDEAQDIVGIRAELVQALIGGLRPECGVTIFADRAQAIYGFTEDESLGAQEGQSLLKYLEGMDFSAANLSKVHRTGQPGLLRIFTDVRETVLDEKTPTAVRRAAVREQIKRFADGDAGSFQQLKLDQIPDDALVLMRRRADVLLASSYGQDRKHRIRMSGLPSRILPWVGELLWDHTDTRLTRPEFDERWQNGVTTLPQEASDGAWNLLMEAAGLSAHVVDVERLRNLLGRASPPSLFTSPDYGDGGPVIGTIHASKGREAEDVHLYLPPESNDDTDDEDEEIRVMFVGATRARKRLSVGSTGARRTSDHDGRVWKRHAKGKIQIEVGRMHDLDADGLVGRTAFASAGDARAAQERIQKNPVIKGLFASAQQDLRWRMSVEHDASRLCVLSERLKSDLWEISKKCEGGPIGYLAHLRSIGLRTVALRMDDPSLQYLHEPWASSGFMLAPMLTGFCMSRFGGKK